MCMFTKNYWDVNSMAYKNLLKDWGLQEYISCFEEEGIDDESFHLLDNTVIDTILKKSGPRLIFKNKYWGSRTIVNTSTTSHVQICEQQDSDSECTSCGSSNIISLEIERPEQEMSMSLEEPGIPESSIPDPDISFIAPPALKKTRHSRIFSDTLENILRKYPEGKIILLHRHKLNNDLRQKLAKLVVNEMLNSSPDLRAEVFQEAAEEIVNLFPGEVKETYFIPYCSGKIGLRQPAKGKLWSRYVNVRAALRIANRSALKWEIAPLNKVSSQCDIYNKEVENDMTFLKHAIEPYPRILKAWENTFQHRKSLYRDCDLDIVFKEFPCLKEQFALELLESDFNQLYPEKIDVIYDKWPKISEAILKEASERKLSLSSGLDNSLQALLILPLLFTPITLRKSTKGKTNWRPTRSEVQESFIFNAETLSDVSAIIERRKAKLDLYGLPLQPFGILLGKKENIENYFIFMFNTKYQVNSVIRCLELLYKVIHALNFEYPVESKHIWHFIQESVFEMPATSKSSSTACVMSDISFHMS